MTAPEQTAAPNFIRRIIEDDLRAGTHGGRVHTRFPPEPNGYLHIGHAKSICLNFGLAADFGGLCNLRFDDTNPETEDVEYVESIQNDVRWLGFDWQERLFFASDYFERLHDYAVELIRRGKAYVDSLNAEEIRTLRGSLTEPGKESPHRNRSVEENLDLFARMRAGEFPDGAHVLRARIDMAAPNVNLRDPVIYRIRRATHHRTGDKWCIYPMYDFTHGLSDAIEHITHSICTLEFEDHRPLYDWFLDNLTTPSRPRQYEFARLNLDYTVLSKRRLIALVEGGHVTGWDDPRMPTLAGIRRRGYTPEAIRDFCERIGVTKNDTCIDFAVLENSVREHLGHVAPRVMAVLDPVKVVIENYPAGQLEQLPAANHPQRPELGSRAVPFAREIFIEREDFMEDPPKGFHRLVPGREVRLRYAYFIKCIGVVKDPASGAITELRCAYDPATRGGDAPDGRKVKGTLHWVAAPAALDAEVRLYDRLFRVPDPDAAGGDWLGHLNPESAKVFTGCKLEPALRAAAAGSRYQFERLGYFCADAADSRPGAPVFNRTATLKDSWAKTGGR
ncbi:MAG: glutamine--tRNA ligase/YqeY domain fusion protein [Gammaproteobacteria bacterium]|nr:glutamine--tRNA ligase/YqeY domain fusion protein [Gammaproteobacteria bacterium]